MPHRNRYEDRDRWREERDENIFDRARRWLRDEDRDYDHESFYNRNHDDVRDYDDRSRQWRTNRNYDYGQESSPGIYGDRYGQNYERPWQEARRRDWQYGDRDWDDRYIGQDRYQSDWERSRDFDRDHWRSERENYSRDYGRGYNRGYENQDDWLEDEDYRYERYGNRSPYTYGLGRERYGWQSYDDQDNWGFGTGYRSDENMPYRRRGYQRPYPTAGMRSDYEQPYRYGREYPEYRGRRQEYDRWNRNDSIGYESEGAFYQDLDEPYTYEYWEIWDVPGEFIGMGPQNYQRSDDRIHEDVCERLTRHGRIDASEMEIDVQDGEVTLKGSVPQREMKRVAEDTVEAVTGVKNVNNELRVQQRESSRFGQPNRQFESGTQTTNRTQGGTSTGGSTADWSTKGSGGVEDKRRQLREGMEVIGKNGKVVGTVKQIRDRDFLVDREMARDVFVPFNAVQSIGAQAMLSVTEDDVDNQDWEKPDILG